MIDIVHVTALAHAGHASRRDTRSSYTMPYRSGLARTFGLNSARLYISKFCSSNRRGKPSVLLCASRNGVLTSLVSVFPSTLYISMGWTSGSAKSR